MNREEIIRAWKDEEYRSTLSSTELAALPQHPAGVIELSEEETQMVGGLTGVTISVEVFTQLTPELYVTLFVDCFYTQ